MPLRFLLDENQRGPLRKAVLHRRHWPDWRVDVVCVGEEAVPSLGTPDPDLLIWCEVNDRLLITGDKTTMPVHLAAHLRAGRHVPGVFILRDRYRIQPVLQLLELVVEDDSPESWRDRHHRIP